MGDFRPPVLYRTYSPTLRSNLLGLAGQCRHTTQDATELLGDLTARETVNDLADVTLTAFASLGIDNHDIDTRRRLTVAHLAVLVSK